MAQAIWKGGINFALVHIPVSIHAAESSDDEVSLRMLDGRDHSRIRYTRVNENTGKEVDWDEIVKGYEYEEGQYVVHTDEDFEAAASKLEDSIEIEGFVTVASIAPAFLERPYFLVPGKGGEKGYVLLHNVLSKTMKGALARVVLRTKERIALIIPVEHALQLILLRYGGELRTAEEAGVPRAIFDISPSPREIAIAQQLLDQMTERWQPSKYRDRYQEALRAVIDERIKGAAKGRRKQPAKAKRADVIDMVELLKKSLKSSEPKESRKRA
jgi:DNA end-binding protein Ku